MARLAELFSWALIIFHVQSSTTVNGLDDISSDFSDMDVSGISDNLAYFTSWLGRDLEYQRVQKANRRGTTPHVLKNGETVWDVAAEKLGSGLLWRFLSYDFFGVYPVSPYDTVQGDRVWVPTGISRKNTSNFVETGPFVSSLEQQHALVPYTVEDGDDSLQKIALRLLGDSSRQDEIFDDPFGSTRSNSSMPIIGRQVYVPAHEGDIHLTSWQLGAIHKPEQSLPGTVPVQLWEHGIVPFVIDAQISSSLRNKITMALNIFMDRTCVAFRTKTSSDEDYISFEATSGRSPCYSRLGRTGGKQILSIGIGCESIGIILHEVAHSIGLVHQHTRSDRDTHMRVFPARAEPYGQGYFDTYDLAIFGTNSLVANQYSFDAGSIMRWGEKAYSMTDIDDGSTIESLVANTTLGQVFGQNSRLSVGDVKTIRHLYSCRKPTSTCSFTLHGLDYDGFVNTTRSGKNCRIWHEIYLGSMGDVDVTIPANHNYCRNPNNTAMGPWCYFSQKGINSIEYCNVGTPDMPRCFSPLPAPTTFASKPPTPSPSLSEPEIFGQCPNVNLENVPWQAPSTFDDGSSETKYHFWSLARYMPQQCNWYIEGGSSFTIHYLQLDCNTSKLHFFVGAVNEPSLSLCGTIVGPKTFLLSDFFLDQHPRVESLRIFFESTSSIPGKGFKVSVNDESSKHLVTRCTTKDISGDMGSRQCALPFFSGSTLHASCLPMKGDTNVSVIGTKTTNDTQVSLWCSLSPSFKFGSPWAFCGTSNLYHVANSNRSSKHTRLLYTPNHVHLLTCTYRGVYNITNKPVDARAHPFPNCNSNYFGSDFTNNTSSYGSISRRLFATCVGNNDGKQEMYCICTFVSTQRWHTQYRDHVFMYWWQSPSRSLCSSYTCYRSL